MHVTNSTQKNEHVKLGNLSSCLTDVHIVTHVSGIKTNDRIKHVLMDVQSLPESAQYPYLMVVHTLIHQVPR